MDPVPATRPPRAIGVLMIVDPLCWGLMAVAVATAAGSYVIAALWSAGTALTPTPDAEEERAVLITVLTVLVVVAAVLMLATVVLDVIVAVMALRRLRERSRAVPILALVVIGVTTGVPLLIAGLAIGARAAEMLDTYHLLLWLLVGVGIGIGSWARMAQLIGGILTLATTPART